MLSILLKLRSELSIILDRPTLNDRDLDHESYFSRYQSGSLLKRHLDEKHKEIKGVSFLIFSYAFFVL